MCFCIVRCTECMRMASLANCFGIGSAVIIVAFIFLNGFPMRAIVWHFAAVLIAVQALFAHRSAVTVCM